MDHWKMNPSRSKVTVADTGNGPLEDEPFLVGRTKDGVEGIRSTC